MSRYNLSQSQIDLLNFDEIENLRKEINSELVLLNQTEWKVHIRRRELELERNPELGIKPFVQDPKHSSVIKPMQDLETIVSKLLAQGHDLSHLFKK